MKRTCGNAALLAFTARLLNTGVVSSRPSPPSPRRARLSSPPPSLGPSPRRPSYHQAFVHPDLRGSALSSGGARSESSGSFTPSPSPSPVLPSPRIWRKRNASARRTQRVATVAPRRYVDSSVSDGEVIAAPNLVGEFSLLSPHLEFSELELQELLFSKGVRARACAEFPPPASQLYEEFQEVEIGHFRPAKALSEGKASSPLFFASPQQKDMTTDDHIKRDSAPPTLPPWLSLNQARFAPAKVRQLQRDLEPHLSTLKIREVVSALYLAASDYASAGDFSTFIAGADQKKVAGAADFCSLLVHSLEITDTPALCAAAFHYSSLVAVRESELAHVRNSELCPAERECLCHAGSDAKYLCALAGLGLERFGEHAVKIALDAARLKSMEELATTVVHKIGKRGPLSSAAARNFRRLLLTVNEEGDWRALAIRSAACLYRLEGLEAYRSRRPTASGTGTSAVSPEESRASQEALHIYAPLAARLGMFRLKTKLEDAAFRTLYPRSHAKVLALCGGANTNNVGEGMKSVLDDMSFQIKRLVQEDCAFMEHIENVSVTARVKEPYSVWKKMVKMSRKGEGVNTRHLSILDIPDAVAVRVVFSARKLAPDESDATTEQRERELCYHLNDLCQQTWPKVGDSRFKDYVKNPKENGYQSLHYSSRKRWRGTEWPFEVQIRSKEMHRIAEYGMAAHWSYKRKDIDGGEATEIPLDRTSEAYLKSAQEWRTKQDSGYSATTKNEGTELNEPAWYLDEELRRQRKRDRDKTLAPYLEALSGAQMDMTRENVFVFVSVQPPKEEQESGVSSLAPSPVTEGTVLSLPAGSRVLDAVRVTEKWSSMLESSGQLYNGRASFVALRNGLRTSSLGTELLASGDVVSIVPSADLIPSFAIGRIESGFTGSPFFQ